MGDRQNAIEEYGEITVIMREYVEEQIKLGIYEFDRTPIKNETPTNSGVKNVEEKLEFNLGSLREKVSSCEECELHKERNHVVFGSGNENADLMFVGEAPGKDEDLQGKPFVGRAGKLLDKIIAAMNLHRNELYIANVVKCRPPANRNPKPIELETCEPFLIKQIDLIKPKVICGLGTFAVQRLLKTDEKISKLRGNWHEYHGIKVMPTYHPAYLLRNASAKRFVWEDMQLVMAELGL